MTLFYVLICLMIWVFFIIHTKLASNQVTINDVIILLILAFIPLINLFGLVVLIIDLCVRYGDKRIW